MTESVPAIAIEALPITSGQDAGELLAETAEAAEATEASKREEHIQKLLARLSQNPDFPSLRDSIRSIQKLARAENTHLRVFTEEILADVALSNKLLRLINTAFYSSVGGGTIDNLSRAISLMGFQSVGMLAASLKLFDNLPQGPSAIRVQQEFSRAIMAGLLANEICPSHKLAESTYLTALFQNLGRMLIWMHFPSEASHIESMTRQSLGNTHPDDLAADGRYALQILHDNRHAKSILYVSFDDLSCEVARLWGWPDNLRTSLRPYLPDSPDLHIKTEEYVRVACSLSNHLAVLLAETPLENQEFELQRFQSRWSQVYGEDSEDFATMLQRVDAQWSQMAQVMNLAKLSPLLEKNLSQVQSAMKRHEPLPAAFMLTSVLRRPDESGGLGVMPNKTDSNQAIPGKAKGVLGQSDVQAMNQPRLIQPSLRTQSHAKPSQVLSVNPDPFESMDPLEAKLSRRIDEISERVIGEASLAEITMLSAKILMECLDAQRVIIALKDRQSPNLSGRLGVGDEGAAISQRFHIPMAPPSDLFGLLCAKHADTLISDASEHAIAARLPAWYRSHVNGSTFLILPISKAGLVLGMIYADRATPHSLQMKDHILNRLKTLRNQVTMAIHTRSLEDF